MIEVSEAKVLVKISIQTPKNNLFQIKIIIMAKTYEIYPAIGIARVGNSTESWYLGQETPQLDFLPEGGSYRDSSFNLKPMGCKFRIYEMEDGKAIREIALSAEVTQIKWRIELGNLKNPRQPLNTGNLEISGTDQHQPIEISAQGLALHMGDLRTDNEGRFILVGSNQNAGTYPGGAGDYDTTSDGRLSATIVINGAEVRTNTAWAIVAPPDYAHPMEPIVTVYDLMLNHFYDGGDVGEVFFGRDIFRVLRSSVLMQWTSSRANIGHSRGGGDFLNPSILDMLKNPDPQYNGIRQRIFSRLKPNGNMPDLISLQLTNYQLAQMTKWKDGNFTLEPGWVPTYNDPPLAGFPVADRPTALNQAALLPAVGGSFIPGIEVGSRIADRNFFSSPFRVKDDVAPGYFTQTLFLPWQKDVPICAPVYWPSGYPGDVLPQGSTQRRPWQQGAGGFPANLETWFELGFIIKEGEDYTEQERTLSPALAAAETYERASEVLSLEQKTELYRAHLAERGITEDV